MELTSVQIAVTLGAVSLESTEGGWCVDDNSDACAYFAVTDSFCNVLASVLVRRTDGRSGVAT